MPDTHERQVILHEVLQTRQLRPDFRQRLGHLRSAVRRRLAQFFFQQVHMEHGGTEGVADCM
jgi:hypothetical protein